MSKEPYSVEGSGQGSHTHSDSLGDRGLGGREQFREACRETRETDQICLGLEAAAAPRQRLLD